MQFSGDYEKDVNKCWIYDYVKKKNALLLINILFAPSYDRNSIFSPVLFEYYLLQIVSILINIRNAFDNIY